MHPDFFLPDGYEYLAPDCERFFAEHPDYARNVFIMTRFEPGNRLLTQLDEVLRKALCGHGLAGLRADDRMYPLDRQLWKNVCVYMLCCKYGVAVLEDRLKDEFNPNVALEYGFMRALDKPVLLLADTGFHNLRADVIGTLREGFDITDIGATLPRAVGAWVRDLDLDPQPQPGALREQAFKIVRRLRNIDCARLVADDASRLKERNDEFWYLGEEISAYRALLDTQPDAAHRDAVDTTDRRLVQGHDLAALPEMIRVFTGLARRP